MLLVGIVIALLLVALAALLSAVETAVLLLPAGRVHRLVESQRARRRGSWTTSWSSGIACGPSPRSSAGSRSLRWVLQVLPSCCRGCRLGCRPTGRPVRHPLDDVLWRPPSGGLLGVALTHSLAEALPRTLAVANAERIGLSGSPAALADHARLLYPAVAPARCTLALGGRGRGQGAHAHAVGGDTGVPRRVAGEEGEREEAEEALLEAVLGLRREGRARGDGAAHRRRRLCRTPRRSARPSR